MSSPAPTPAEPTVELKNRWLAGVLALLLPGLGHFYQGRTFKAAIYCVCILGLFFTGQALGEWKVVYLGDSESGGRIAAGRGVVKRLLQGYAAQFPVGVFAWPAIVQSNRYQAEEERGRTDLNGPLDSEFQGGIWVDTLNGPLPILGLNGRIRIEPINGSESGTFVGTTEDGSNVKIELGPVLELGREVSANEDRTLRTAITSLPDGLEIPPEAGANSRIFLAGAIQRSFWDRYQVPLGDSGEDSLTAELGGQLEIAYVFTWIAGLLNVLAIWDALDGPAYGYGDGSASDRKRRRRRDESEADEAVGRKLETSGRTA